MNKSIKMSPTNQPTNNQKLSEMEDIVTSYVEKMDSIVSDLRDSQKTTAERFEAMDTKIDSRFQAIEDLLKRILPNTLQQQVDHRDVHVHENITNTGINNSDSVHISLESNDEHHDSVNRAMNRDSLLRKVEMPIFEGTNAFGLITKVERFFQIGKYSDTEKLRIVSLSLDGDVLSWYNWQTNRVPFANWNEFKVKLLARFGQDGLGSPNQRLFALKQLGTVSEYVHDFEDLSSQVSNLDDENLECIFMNGLKPKGQDLVLFLKLIGLNAVIEAAVRVETRTICKMVENTINQHNRNSKALYTQSHSECVSEQ